MDEIIKYLLKNPVIAVVAASLLILLSGIILNKTKILAIILILVAAFVFYILLHSNKLGKIDVDEIKKNVKNKVMDEIKGGNIGKSKTR